MSVKERLIEFLKSQGISQRLFEQTIGVSNGYVNNIRVSIQPDKVQRIAQHYPNINTGWLLSGEGEMLKGETKAPNGSVAIPREVFDRMSQLIDTVCSQQGTIAAQQQVVAEQHRTIDRLINKSYLENKVDSSH